MNNIRQTLSEKLISSSLTIDLVISGFKCHVLIKFYRCSLLNLLRSESDFYYVFLPKKIAMGGKSLRKNFIIFRWVVFWFRWCSVFLIHLLIKIVIRSVTFYLFFWFFAVIIYIFVSIFGFFTSRTNSSILFRIIIKISEQEVPFAYNI